MSLSMSFCFSSHLKLKEGQPFWNVFIFASSFLFEHIMLAINDVVVTIAGTNFFFPNKPRQFHDKCAKYCRCALIVRSVLWYFGGGYKAWLFLLLAETLWSIPPHPASAMFVTNHGSDINESDIILAYRPPQPMLVDGTPFLPLVQIIIVSIMTSLQYPCMPWAN